jgi:hypothetical protein
MTIKRRHFLTAIPALLAAGKAQAISLDEGSPRLAEIIANRCGQTSEHARMLAEAEKILTDAGYSEAERKTVMAEFNCPVCGCKISTAK